MSDIEDFLMSYVEPILIRARKPAETPDTKQGKKQYEKLEKKPYNIPIIENLIQKENSISPLKEEIKKLEFYSNNLDKLNKKFEKEFKKFKPIPTECAQCQYYFMKEACEEARKNHDCRKYK